MPSFVNARNILAIETSSDKRSLALVAGDATFEERINNERKRYDVNLIELVNCLLVRANLTLNNVDLIAVSAGPGSFTGIRVGLSMAKGFGFPVNIPVLSFSSTEILANGTGISGMDVCPVIPSRKNEIFTAVFSADDFGNISRKRNDIAVQVPEFFKDIKRKTLIVGSGLFLYEDMIRCIVGDNALFPNDNEVNFPRASVLARLAQCAWRKGRMEHDHSIIPHYVKKHGYRQNM